MIEFGGINYYIDFDAIDKLIGGEKSLKAQTLTELETTNYFDKDKNLLNISVTEKSYQKSKEIDISKYDFLSMMLQTVINYNIEIDDSLGAERALEATSLQFKIAFNTLIQYGILKEKE